MPGSVRALKAALKLHNYNSARDKNNDTQRMHTQNAHKNGPNPHFATLLVHFKREGRKERGEGADTPRVTNDFYGVLG